MAHQSTYQSYCGTLGDDLVMCDASPRRVSTLTWPVFCSQFSSAEGSLALFPFHCALAQKCHRLLSSKTIRDHAHPLKYPHSPQWNVLKFSFLSLAEVGRSSPMVVTPLTRPPFLFLEPKRMLGGANHGTRLNFERQEIVASASLFGPP